MVTGYIMTGSDRLIRQGCARGAQPGCHRELLFACHWHSFFHIKTLVLLSVSFASINLNLEFELRALRATLRLI